MTTDSSRSRTVINPNKSEDWLLAVGCLSLTLSIPKLSASCKSKKQGESKFEFRETIQHPKVLQISNLCKVLKWKELPGD
ncbi:hypothetical protein V6N11_041435 [Hibiscus sabdariffa]|uniref:Uncharacterized protein n=1 Tax=Hibiscus sabdariffa TaxID=183260 RepID=A0ABR2RKI4_9ROSI